MSDQPALPAGLTLRPARPADAAPAAAVLRADEAATAGRAFTTEGDLSSSWRRPSVSLTTDVVVVTEHDRLVGYAECIDGVAWVGVHPDAWGRGIGAALLGWTQTQAHRQGRRRIDQTIPDGNDAAAELLHRRGYRPRWQSWVFGIRLQGPSAPPVLPDGMVLRPMVRPEEDAAVHRVVEEAFSEWPDREQGRSLADWRAASLDRDDTVVLVVADRHQPVGAAVCLVEANGEGWVEQLAVARDHRGRGLGRALLQGAFRRFAELGCTTAALSTDSRTGARSLYEHVGMRVTASFTRWSATLTPAGDVDAGRPPDGIRA